jgi:hypothetical protein
VHDLISHRIALPLDSMNAAIHFDGKVGFVAKEIRDIGPNNVLATKAKVIQALQSQVFP